MGGIMANHGKCYNCWWYEPTKFDLREARMVEGNCWNLRKNSCRFDSYCPDYCNREHENRKTGSLQEWIKNLPATLPKSNE